jgi:hypothetical protein
MSDEAIFTECGQVPGTLGFGLKKIHTILSSSRYIQGKLLGGLDFRRILFLVLNFVRILMKTAISFR